MKKQSEDYWWRFVHLCQETATDERLDEVFDLFLTRSERDAIKQRYGIVEELLKKECTQREMAKKLKTSIAKITRGSNYLKEINPDLRRFLAGHVLQKNQPD